MNALIRHILAFARRVVSSIRAARERQRLEAMRLRYVGASAAVAEIERELDAHCHNCEMRGFCDEYKCAWAALRKECEG